MPKRNATTQKSIRQQGGKVRPVDSEPSGEERIAHYNAILIEDLKSQFKLVIEHVEGVRESLQQEMADGFRTVNARLDFHDDCFKENASRWQENDKRWQENAAWQRENMSLLSRFF